MSSLSRRVGLAAILVLGGCGGGGGAGPVPPDAAAPDRGAGPDLAVDLAPSDALTTPDAASEAIAADGAAPLDAAAVPIPDPVAALQVAPIVWAPCPSADLGDDCADVKAPLDYAHPEGAQIDLFVARVRASDPRNRIGSLFMNPGGPGAGGVSEGFLAGVAGGVGDQLRARFDLVSWDPRGVPRSRAVDCKANPTISALEQMYDHSSGTPSRDALVAAYARWVEQCKTGAGDLIPFVATSSTVSDLELLRRAVGDPRLTYLGFSYGTGLGLHYYARYHDRVRAMVLDGVESIWPGDFGETDQDDAFEAALQAFFDWCGKARAQDCAFARATASKAAAFDDLMKAIALKPVPAGNGRMLNAVLVKWAVGNYLYSQGNWPALGAALEGARTGNGSRLFAAAQSYLGTGASQDPFYAINCDDGSVTTVADIDAYAAKLQGSRVGLPYASLACVGWPVHDLSPPPPVPSGSLPPLVLIGSVGDPATPYRWAMAVKAHLGDAATLMTSEAFTHTSFAAGDPCIDDPVTAYLVAGTVPAAGIRCAAAAPTALLVGKGTAAEVRAPWFRPPRVRR